MDSTRTPPAVQGNQPGDLGREVRQSLLLLGISVAVTAVVTVGAQAAAALLS